MSISNLSPKQLRRAAQIKEKIEKLQNELSGLLGNGTATPTKPKRKMSKAGRAKIAAAQKKRWAAVKAKKK
jgi:hypothetical protein